VGYVLPTCTVYRAVAETARAAAFDDNRFAPVTKPEAPFLQIELSHSCRSRIDCGRGDRNRRHGLLISWYGRAAYSCRK